MDTGLTLGGGAAATVWPAPLLRNAPEPAAGGGGGVKRPAPLASTRGASCAFACASSSARRNAAALAKRS